MDAIREETLARDSHFCRIIGGPNAGDIYLIPAHLSHWNTAESPTLNCFIHADMPVKYEPLKMFSHRREYAGNPLYFEFIG